MPRGIIIFGPAGAGKTTLGRLLAEQLGYPYFDLDDYIWKKDTEVPFTVMYTRSEKADRLMADISHHAHFVMAGSMNSFHDPFDPLFDLAVHLKADTDVRKSRIQARESAAFGDRIQQGGDMYQQHQLFLQDCDTYAKDDYPTRKQHLEWAATLPCKVISLNGEDALEENVQKIVVAYKEIQPPQHPNKL